jgi:asparagine synthase (glutamine-hydrolysing)
MQHAFFCVAMRGERPEARGMPDCFLGHRFEQQHGHEDGIFAQWSWDGAQLRARNDRYGFFPLYFSSLNGWFGISPSIPLLIARGASAELDYEALAVFFRVGFFVGETTPFKHIRALPPNASLTWQAGDLRLTGSRPRPQPQLLARREAIDAYIALVRQSIRRRLPPDEDFVVPLSGGRDSRHLLFELCENGRTPKFCATIAKYPPTPDDSTVARMVASRLNVPHVVLAQKEPWFQTEARKNQETSFCTDEGAWLLELSDYLKGRASTVYDGIGGDVLCGLFLTPELLSLFEQRSHDRLIDQLMTGSRLLPDGESTIARVLKPEHYERLSLEVARHRLSEELKTHQDAPNPVGSFYFWNRTRREISLSPYCVLQAVIPTVYAPYLDSDLYDFMSSLPASLFLDHTFHDEAISRAYPQYSGIPYQSKNAERPDATRHGSDLFRAVARCVLTRTRRPSRLMRNRYLLPRLMYGVRSRRYRERSLWLSPQFILYLFQLEAIATGL